MSQETTAAARFAELLCDWCLEVQTGQQVAVNTSTLALEPVRALHAAILRRGAWPLLHLSPPWLVADFHRWAREEHLDGFPRAELAQAEAIDSRVFIDAPANTQALSGVDPMQIARARRARDPVRAVELGKRWCVSVWPTPALAQAAGMSDMDYAALVQGAMFLDREDPVAAWRELSARQAAMVGRLSGVREIRIEAPGTDLRLGVGGRTWINSDGRRNMPSGEVFTGPVEDSAEGAVRFTVPTGPGGVDVSGVELTFAAGEVVSARAERGSAYLEAALATDPGARRLGELGIGTNSGIDRATGSILLDEKIAGTVHLALGRSYAETGGNNVSSLHWDLICDLRDGGRLSADGEPVIEDGRLIG